MNKRGRPSTIIVKLTITSNDDDRFSSRRTSDNMMDASIATELTDRGIRMAYNSGRESMRKRSGAIYYFKWEEPDPIPVTIPQSRASLGPPRTSLKECKSCSKTLTFEDRSNFFGIDLGYGTEDTCIFTSVCQASRETGISICTLRNACSKGNMSIMKRKEGMQTYRLFWPGKCKSCG